jgi:hypothetical protein
VRIKNADWRYLVDALLFVCLVGMVFIGILLGFVLQEGPVSAGGSKYFLGIHRHQWGNIHAYLSIAFVILMVVHLTLSWNWVTCRTRQIFKGRSAAPLVALATLPFVILLFFWIGTPKDADVFKSYGAGAGDRALISRAQRRKAPPPAEVAVREDTLRSLDEPAAPAAPVVESERHHEGEIHDQPGSVTITGRHTLRDLESATGISAREIARRMGLPEQIPVNETLGRLRRLYGFEIDEVRDVVSLLLEEREGRQD